MPYCQCSLGRQSTHHIYTHPVAVSQVGQDDSRGTRDEDIWHNEGRKSRMARRLTYNSKENTSHFIISDQSVMSDQRSGQVMF